MDDYDIDLDMAYEAASMNRAANALRSRAFLDPRDPDALDEDEQERLEELENWEP